MTHVIGSTVEVECYVSGRYIAIRIEVGDDPTDAYFWRLDSYDIDVVTMGGW
jgi:hypothetical protein